MSTNNNSSNEHTRSKRGNELKMEVATIRLTDGYNGDNLYPDLRRIYG